MLNEFVNVINAADSARLAKFIDEHFLVEPGGPSVEQRVTPLTDPRDSTGRPLAPVEPTASPID